MLFILFDTVTNIVQSVSTKAPSMIPAGQQMATANEEFIPTWRKVLQSPTSYQYQNGQFTLLPNHMLSSAFSPIVSGGSRGWNVKQPSLPAGTGVANAVINTNSFAVRVYQKTGAGTHIIDANGVDVALAADPPEFVLDPGAKVYFATTVPTGWNWYGA